MKNLRMRGGVAAAIVAAAAMVLSTIAIAPAYAADNASTCIVSNADDLTSAVTEKTCETIQVNKPSDGIIRFNYQSKILNVGPKAYNAAKNIEVPSGRHVVITSSDQVILRNVQFTIPSSAELTLAGKIVVDDVNLSGYNLVGLLSLNVGDVTPKTFDGVTFGVKVNGGIFNMEGDSHVAVGADGVVKANHAVVVSGAGSEVNLNSSGTYDREAKAALLDTDLAVLKYLIGSLLEALTIKRTVAYPTVWGRDAAVYSEPNVTDATINITKGTYSNQKDSAAFGQSYLNGAISTSATVNITGENNVKISNMKIGNGVDSSHNGVNTGGTLNISNKNATLDPAVENDTDAQNAATDSWALELRGNSTVNLVAGNIQDTLHTDGHKVIESESTAKVNILNTQYTDQSNGTKYKANIENRGYYIEPTTLQSDGTYTAWVNADASASDPTGADNYVMQTSNAAANSDPLAQLQALTSATNVTDADGSSYTTGRLNAAFANVNNQAVYGTKIISDGSTNATPFQTVNGAKDPTKKGGTVTLYGAPWTGTYKPGDAAPEQTGNLFAGWYTSKTAFDKEDALQGTQPTGSYANFHQDPRHHDWPDAADGNVQETFPTPENSGGIVLNKGTYGGSLYAHFVPTDTIKVTAQTSAPTNGKAKYFNVRLLGGMDSYNFKGATFDLYRTASAEKSFGRLSTKNVYDYVSQTVATTDGTESTTKTVKRAFAANPYYQVHKSEFEVKDAQGAARYLTTGVVKNVPEGTTLYVQPTWTTLDGTTVTGARYALTVNADGTVSTTK